jgi:hypothetical protein
LWHKTKRDDASTHMLCEQNLMPSSMQLGCSAQTHSLRTYNSIGCAEPTPKSVRLAKLCGPKQANTGQRQVRSVLLIPARLALFVGEEGMIALKARTMTNRAIAPVVHLRICFDVDGFCRATDTCRSEPKTDALWALTVPVGMIATPLGEASWLFLHCHRSSHEHINRWMNAAYATRLARRTMGYGY